MQTKWPEKFYNSVTTRKTAIGSTAIRSALNMWYVACIYPQCTCAHALRVCDLPAAHHIFGALRVFVRLEGVPSPNLPVAYVSDMRMTYDIPSTTAGGCQRTGLL
jgi:hypothetical protein